MQSVLKISMLFVMLALLSVASNKKVAPTAEKPHIIILYTDDRGIGDLSCYNSGWVQTRNIDKLAAEGV